jgi:uncharacterized membrane protein (DUF485 family)
MAVTYTNITDGQSVTTWATNANSFGNAVKANIDTIEADITTLESSKLSASGMGLIYAVSNTGVLQNLTASYAKVYMVDTISINSANSHITVNVGAGTITFNTTGVYNIHASGSITSTNNVLVQFNYNINGVSVITTPPKFTGAGAQPYAIANSTFVQVTAGAVLYIEAKSDSAATFTPTGFGISVEKTHY